nr:protein DDB_G0276689-like [Dermatophagoides farinae]
MKIVSCRFLFGSLILLLVDTLWVASSEMTEYLYHEKNFNKPFFTAYIKGVMFSLYLFGFIFFDSWWTQKNHLNPGDYYSIVSDSDQQNLTLDDDEDEEEEDDDDDDEDSDDNNDRTTENVMKNSNISDGMAINSSSKDMESVKSSNSHFLSDSVWIPIKRCSDTSSLSGKSSETEDDESVSGDGHVFIDNNPSNAILIGDSKNNSTKNNKNKNISSSSNVNFIKKTSSSSKRSKSKMKEKLKSKRLVRFSNLIEVRQLSDKHADDAFLSRLSYSSFMRVLYQRNRQRLHSNTNELTGNNQSTSPLSSSNYGHHHHHHHHDHTNKLTIRETAILAFYFTWIWFAAHLSFHMGLQYSEAGLVNVLSSTTPLFTLLLGILFPSGSVTDSLSLTKLLCVLLSISSVAMISNIEPINPHQSSNQPFQANNLATINNNHNNNSGKLNMANNETILPLGSIWSLCGAFFYSVYIVLMRYNLVHDSMLNFPMFFGFIGLFSMIFMSPFLMLLNFTHIETFQWPSQDQWILILVNGLCGTVISELLWLLGSFMTSSLVGTISVSFTIPMAVFFDIFYKNIEYPRVFFLGTIPMFFSFIIVIFISQYERWDPILEILERCLYSIGSSPRKTFNCSTGTIRLEESLNEIRKSDNGDDEKNHKNTNHHHHHQQHSGKNNHSTKNETTMDQIIDTTNNIEMNTCDSHNKHSNNHQLPSSSTSTSIRHYQFNKQRIADQNNHHNDRHDDDDDEHNEQTKSLIEAAEADAASSSSKI